MKKVIPGINKANVAFSAEVGKMSIDASDNDRKTISSLPSMNYV